ncbi:MAG: hypothetical protein CMM58_01455 [Rhodospirillaceae bacterium]|nr:hypothetical protein [Rhodospirillaceae bacterium]
MSALGFAAMIFMSPMNLSTCLSQLGDELRAQGWREVTFKKKEANRFLKCGEDCIRVDSNNSVSMIFETKSVNLVDRYLLTWEWKLEKPAVKSDITRRGRDDRALAIYVGFPYDAKTASLAERAARPFIKRKKGPNAPGRMLAYIWAGHGYRGDLYSSPFFGKINKMIVKRNSGDAAGVWLKEQADIVSDHKKAFGTVPARVTQILISADTDNTKTSNTGFVRKIKFTTP